MLSRVFVVPPFIVCKSDLLYTEGLIVLRSLSHYHLKIHCRYLGELHGTILAWLEALL